MLWLLDHMVIFIKWSCENTSHYDSFQVLAGKVVPYFWAHMLVDPGMQKRDKHPFSFQKGSGTNWIFCSWGLGMAVSTQSHDTAQELILTLSIQWAHSYLYIKD